MDMIISAVLGEAISRSISFIISRSSKQKVPHDVQDSLQRVLLRAQVIIDEATGRHITNQGMLHQLGMLRDAMYQGNYILDTSIYQSHDLVDRKDSFMSHSLSLCKVNSLRGIPSSRRNTEILEELQHAVNNLSSMILDVKELVVFLTSYPRLYRQPYSMHLLLSNCMFGRQMEAHLVISFLLDTQPCGSEELEVLPIVGPFGVGKSTLVSQVCKDERIRDHFSEIFLLNGHEFTDFDHAKLSKGCASEHQNHVLNSNKDRRLLVVVELDGDINEDAWNKLFSPYKQYVPMGSKIIVTSRSDKVIKFGTKPPLHLKYLSLEAYWYFFKTLTFGSTDPKMHPQFAHVAMEIAMMLGHCFLRANVIASLLRKNFDIHFWCKFLTYLREVIQKNFPRYIGHPFDLLNQNRPVRLWTMATPSDDLVFHCWFRRFSQDEIPKMCCMEMLSLMENLSSYHGSHGLHLTIAMLPLVRFESKKTVATKRKRSTM